MRWFQGNMEFGPRALGNESILADPRSSVMQKNLNLSIKFRKKVLDHLLLLYWKKN